MARRAEWRGLAQCGALIILRPPLIHGPGAKGDLRELLRAIAGGKMLPLGAVRGNRRSMLGVENLCAALVRVVGEPFDACGGEHCRVQLGAPGGRSRVRVYHLSDDGVISSRRLVEVLAEGLGVKPRLVPVPRWAALAAGWPLGKAAAVRQGRGGARSAGAI